MQISYQPDGNISARVTIDLKMIAPADTLWNSVLGELSLWVDFSELNVSPYETLLRKISDGDTPPRGTIRPKLYYDQCSMKQCFRPIVTLLVTFDRIFKMECGFIQNVSVKYAQREHFCKSYNSPKNLVSSQKHYFR